MAFDLRIGYLWKYRKPLPCLLATHKLWSEFPFEWTYCGHASQNLFGLYLSQDIPKDTPSHQSGGSRKIEFLTFDSDLPRWTSLWLFQPLNISHKGPCKNSKSPCLNFSWVCKPKISDEFRFDSSKLELLEFDENSGDWLAGYEQVSWDLSRAEKS